MRRGGTSLGALGMPRPIGMAHYFRKASFGAMDMGARPVIDGVNAEPAPGDVKLAGLDAVDDGGDLFGTLLEQAKAGDREAAWTLFCPYREDLWKSLYRVLGNRQDAEDTLQETWMRAIRGIRMFEGTSPPALRKWLLTISVNCFKESVSQRIRSRQRTVPIDASYDQLSDGRPDHDERTVVLLRLQAMLATLPVKFRQVVELVDVQGWTRDEAARMLRRPVGTVNSQLHAARTALRRAWVVVDD
jgi:RNA polymerase sigma-70 factor, ECF subfamily